MPLDCRPRARSSLSSASRATVLRKTEGAAGHTNARHLPDAWEIGGKLLILLAAPTRCNPYYPRERPGSNYHIKAELRRILATLTNSVLRKCPRIIEMVGSRL